jgi:hypothetical protein
MRLLIGFFLLVLSGFGNSALSQQSSSAVVIFCLCRTSAAQNVYGSTTIDLDPNSGIVTATCETDFDGALDGNYEAEVICSVTDQNGTQVAWGSGADVDGTAGYAQAVLTFSGTPGSTYTATGIHHAIAVLVEQQFLKTVYEDPYNFSNSFESGAGENYPNYYDWFGPGPEQQTKTVSIRLGETKDTLVFPTAPDHLSVVSDSTQPYSCPIGVSRERRVNYNVLDINQAVIARPISVLETVDPSTISNCNGITVAVSNSCTPIATGNFTDGLGPGCPTTPQLALSCGYTFPDQVWKWCNPQPVSPVSIGDIGLDVVDNDIISLGGNSSSFAVGMTFPH